jgi:anaerobic ribonucleoside-triphosphate reductase activating protein
MTVDDILELLDRAMPIEGVTFSGGEPFVQASGLLQLAEAVRERGLSLIAFTGYEIEELTAPDQRRLLGLLDIVVTGRFVASLKSTDLRWRGSSNQRVHFLSERYRADVEDDAAAVEVTLDGRGGIRVTGFPTSELLVQLRGARSG